MLFAAGVFVLASCAGNSPSSVAKSALMNVSEQKYEAFVDQLYMDDAKEKTPEEQAKEKEKVVALLKLKASENIEKQEGIKNIEVLSEEIAEDGKTAVVKMKVTYGNGKTKDETVNLKKNKDDEWKVNPSK